VVVILEEDVAAAGLGVAAWLGVVAAAAAAVAAALDCCADAWFAASVDDFCRFQSPKRVHAFFHRHWVHHWSRFSMP